MKYIYIVDEYISSKKNGIGTYLRELISCLKKIDVNICLLSCCYDSKIFQIEIKDGIKQIQFPVMRDFFSEYYNVIDKFMRLYIEDSQENVFMFNYGPCECLLKSVKKSYPLSKLVFVVHDMAWTSFMFGDKIELKKFMCPERPDLLEKEYSKLLPLLKEEEEMYKTVHQIVALVPETVELLQHVYKVCEKKIVLIPNGLEDKYNKLSKNDMSQLKDKLLISQNEKVILFVGRVNEMKGIYQLLNSLKKVVHLYPDFRFVIAGTIFHAKLIMEYANEIAPKIVFTGQISKKRLNEWYQIADIGVLVSYSEQCSYTGIELMMHGIPVIASDGFGVSDMFRDDENAKIARIGDRNKPIEFEKNLTEALLALLQSDDLRNKLGKCGRIRYETKYGVEQMKERYHTLIQSL